MQVLPGGGEIGLKGRQEWLRIYYGQITMIDDLVGRVLQKLDSLNLTDNTPAETVIRANINSTLNLI